MIPVSELRVAIPVGIASGLDPFLTAVFAIIGNMIPAPFIILFIRRIFRWLKSLNPWLDDKISHYELKLDEKAKKVQKYERFGLFLFIAVPLPGTGAWTGAAIAAVLRMRLRSALPSIFAGVVSAAVIVTCISLGIFHF